MHSFKPLTLGLMATTAVAYTATSRTFAVNHFYGTGPLVEGRMDPIINPGGPSGHVHTVQGGSNFAVTMNDAQALASNCTSSLVKNDKSNYWTPKLYFQYDNGTFVDVPLFYMNVYYFFEPTTDKITAFQPGHRMVSGNPFLRTPPATGGLLINDLSQGEPQPVQFTCPRQNTNTPLYPPDSTGLNGVGIQDPGNKGAGVGFSDKYCDGYASPLRADIHFPSCYDPSQGLDNYKTNMKFPTNGNCPKGWIHTPHLFYEVYWNTPLFSSEWTEGQGKQPFVLAMGDPTGYGLHGDFLSGWDVETLQQIIDNCDAGDSGMDKCPGLIGGLNDPSDSCNIEYPYADQITGHMAALPGDNPIAGWGAVAPIFAPEPATSAAPVPLPTLPVVKIPSASSSSSASSSASSTSGWNYHGCASDNKDGVRVLTGVQFAGIGPVSNTKCVEYCAGKGFTMAGTEYGGQCFCGNALASGSTALAESKCDMPCEGDSTQICGGSDALSVYSASTTGTKRSVGRHLAHHQRRHS